MNKVILIGRLTKDGNRDDNSRFIRSTLAVDGKETQFIPVISFNEKTMDATENYTSKGSLIAVDGTLSINSKKQQDGTYKTFASVIANRIEFLNGKDADQAEKKTPDDYTPSDNQKERIERQKKELAEKDGILWD